MSVAFFVAIPFGIYAAATTDTELNSAALYLGSIFTGEFGIYKYKKPRGREVECGKLPVFE